MMSTAISQSSIVLGTYRSLARLVRQLPRKQQPNAWSQLRKGYRENINESSADKISSLIEEAGEKIAFLRIITPKSSLVSQSGVTRWVYKSGEKDANGEATMRKTRQVISNFDGKNLDPCSVKRHHGQLKRMGFVNNLHAKGLF